MNIPETLLKLPEKELKKILSEENIYKAKYVIRNGSIYEVESKHKGVVFLNRGGVSSIEDFRYRYTPLSLNELDKIKKEQLSNTINNWTYEQWFKWCTKQFINSYGEEYVDWENDPYIIVHFPEITIRNSVEQSHIIRDLYLKFYIGQNGIVINGLRRGTLTDIEVRNDYVFSHVSTGNIFGWNSTFCFGYTEIADLRSRLESGRNNGRMTIFKELKFFLEALKEYFSWESLEGVPYRKIDDVIYDKKLWGDTYKQFHPSMLECVLKELESFTYVFDNSGEEYHVTLDNVSREIIGDILTEKFPESCDLYLEGRSVIKRVIQEQNYENEFIEFKGENRPFKLITVTDVNIELPKRINVSILNEVCAIIETRFNKFLIQKKVNEYNQG